MKSMSDPTLPDDDFKSEMGWAGPPLENASSEPQIGNNVKGISTGLSLNQSLTTNHSSL